MSKKSKTVLTGSDKKRAVADPVGCEVRARLRAVQTELYEIRLLAAKEAQRWPHMEGQLRRASLYVLAQVMTAEVACDPLDDEV
jgi:hypothetical protein